SSVTGVTRSEVPLAPSPRIGVSMAFDPVSNSVILVGGLGPYGSLADTWRWDGARWHALHPSAGAPIRTSAAMTFDPASREVLLLGGDALVPLTDPCQRPLGRAPVCHPVPNERDVSPGADLWGWDGRRWRLRLAANISPHPEGGIVTLPDGMVLAFAANGTWIYDGTVWRRPAPPSRALNNPTGIGVDPTSHQVIAVERY